MRCGIDLLQMRLWLCATAFYQRAGVFCVVRRNRGWEVTDSTVVIGAKFATCLQNLERESIIWSV